MFSDVFGPEGRLIEITSAEVQELAVEVIRAAEESFTIGDPELSYWWTGLQDEDDDGQWVWETSKMMMTVKGLYSHVSWQVVPLSTSPSGTLLPPLTTTGSTACSSSREHFTTANG